MTIDYRKAPFPYFGGKRRAAPTVWGLLGNPSHYVEPFAGSLAVLLERPHKPNRSYYSETVNDADGHICNVWRSLQLHPAETAAAASWPVSEADIHARHVRVVEWATNEPLGRLMGDPDWCDPRIAGWWLYGACAWIGSGWGTTGNGPWWPDSDRTFTKHGHGGVSRQLPQISDDGRGVHHTGLRMPGTGTEDNGYHPIVMPELENWFGWLQARLRHVRIAHGDWSRVCTSGAIRTLSVRQGDGHAGIFMDPPYAHDADRTADLYRVDSDTVSHAVADWCLEWGTRPDYRIVLAGFESEGHERLIDRGWTVHEWYTDGYLTGGYAAGTDDGHQQARERLWASPACAANMDGQLNIFAEPGA